MRTIIAPVSFTPNSDNAARYAADLALSANADLYLLYVVQIPVSTAEFPANGYVLEQMQASGLESLNDLKEELAYRTSNKINIYTHMETGSVERELEQYCDRKKPWMVVMGASGNSLDRLLAGNNLTAALRHLPYPLIVVPPNGSFNHLFHVLIACDPEDAAGGLPVKQDFIRSIDQLFHPNFDVLNINTPGQEGQTEQVFSSQEWQHCIQDFKPGIHSVKAGNVEEGIAEYLDNHPADLLMVFPKKHHFWDFHKSHTKRLALHGDLPILSIHA